MGTSEYAQAGVDYTLIEPFKRHMIEVGRQTLAFPFIKHNVMVRSAEHGAVFEYRGTRPHRFCSVLEGLGNLNWIAEWMYEFSGTGKTYYDVIARAAALIIAIDVIAQGARPVLWEDGVSAGDSEWFADEKRRDDYGKGALAVCRELGMALPAGESPSLKYIIKAHPPVVSCPDLMGQITGIIVPRGQEIKSDRMKVGDSILVCPSTGLGANGISLVIKRALDLPEQFLTRLPTGRTLGEECLIPIRSYAALVAALLDNEVAIHNILPATGDGVGKLAFDKRSFNYRIHSWVPVPPLFRYMRELGVTLSNCLKTFNWGAGIYFFVSPSEVERAIFVANAAGYELVEVGCVEEGERQVIFEPEGITLPPPGQ